MSSNQSDSQLIMMAAALTKITLPSTKALVLDDSISDYLAFGFQKDSEFVGLFNAFLLKLRQTGLLSKIYQRWIPRDELETKTDETATVLGFENLSFPFMGLLWGVGVAFAVGVVEKCLEWKQSRQSTRSFFGDLR